MKCSGWVSFKFNVNLIKEEFFHLPWRCWDISEARRRFKQFILLRTKGRTCSIATNVLSSNNCLWGPSQPFCSSWTDILICRTYKDIIWQPCLKSKLCWKASFSNFSVTIHPINIELSFTLPIVNDFSCLNYVLISCFDELIKIISPVTPVFIHTVYICINTQESQF